MNKTRRNKMTPRRIKRKYVQFCVIGQFVREKQIATLVFNNLFNALIWVFVALLFTNKIFETSFSFASWLSFLLAFRWGFISLDRFGDLGLGYNLTEHYPLSFNAVFSMRLYSKWIQLSEWVFLVLGILVCFWEGASILIAVTISVSIVLLSELSEELVCFLSYKATNAVRFYITLFVIIAILMWGSFTRFKQLTVPIEWVLPITLCLVVVNVLALIACKNNRHRKSSYRSGHGLRSNRAQPKSKHPMSTLGVLMQREFVCLFRHKVDTLISAAVFVLLFVFMSAKGEMFVVMLPAFFAMDFASNYSCNIFGIEGRAIDLLILSPIDRKKVLKAKSLLTLVVSASGIIVFTVVVFVANKADQIYQMIQMLSIGFFTLALLLATSLYASIKYYYPEDRKNPYKIKKLLFVIAVYAVEAVLVAVLYFMSITAVGWIILAALAMLIAIFVTILDPAFFAEILEKKEKEILKLTQMS